MPVYVVVTEPAERLVGRSGRELVAVIVRVFAKPLGVPPAVDDVSVIEVRDVAAISKVGGEPFENVSLFADP